VLTRRGRRSGRVRDREGQVARKKPSNEAAPDNPRAIAKTEAYTVSCRERKKIEMLFAHVKRILRLGRFRLRGPNGPKMSSYWPPPPKTSGNWRSSSRSRHQSSPHKAEGSNPSPDSRRNRYPLSSAEGFFNTSDVKRTLPMSEAEVAFGGRWTTGIASGGTGGEVQRT
jgi:hypothetical protein